MKLSEMKQILAVGDIHLTKSLGQNFLHDGNQLRRIVAAAELKASDKVLEIGPGLGPLTELLLAEAGEVLAIEKDARLVEILYRRFAWAQRQPTPVPSQEGNPARARDVLLTSVGWVGSGSDNVVQTRLLLLHDDALEYLRREPRDWSDWKLVANLPYSVASPILVELAQSKGCPERMVVTLQLEVAQRLVAKPGDKNYGALTLLILLRYEPRGWFKIPASCFFPEPDVASACVALIRRPEPLLNQAQTKVFTKIVKRAFSQRRKMMFKLLKEDWPEEMLADAFERLKLSQQARAEVLSFQQFIDLTNLLI
jgi:16S rRNA (adenine1518-N6/adenine1519-N6)-dimethyltransferase